MEGELRERRHLPSEHREEEDGRRGEVEGEVLAVAHRADDAQGERGERAEGRAEARERAPARRGGGERAEVGVRDP